MKEFIINEKIKDITKYVKVPRNNKTFIVTNMQLSKNYHTLRSSKTEEERRSDILYESFERGLRRL